MKSSKTLTPSARHDPSGRELAGAGGPAASPRPTVKTASSPAGRSIAYCPNCGGCLSGPGAECFSCWLSAEAARRRAATTLKERDATTQPARAARSKKNDRRPPNAGA